jgi:hypothetical protein
MSRRGQNGSAQRSEFEEGLGQTCWTDSEQQHRLLDQAAKVVEELVHNPMLHN